MYLEQVAILQLNVYRRIRSQKLLIEDSYRPHNIIHCIIDVFCKVDTTGTNFDRTTRNVRRIEVNLRVGCTLKLSRELKLIFIRKFGSFDRGQIV